MKKFAKKSLRFLALMSAMQLGACAGANSDIVLPAVTNYGADVQMRAADEFEQLGPPCPKDIVIADCSAVKRMILDYLWLRDQIGVF